MPRYIPQWGSYLGGGAMTDEQDTAFERDYDDVERGKAQCITNPGHWTIWRNSEGFVSVRRYDKGGEGANSIAYIKQYLRSSGEVVFGKGRAK